MEGLLDGLIILDQQTPAGNMSFTRTNFTSQQAAAVQTSMKQCESSQVQGVGAYADFWSVADFWKHYMPFQPEPSEFGRERVRDFSVSLGNGETSGPVVHDLIKPVFNGAVQLAHILSQQLGLEAHNIPAQLP